MPDNNVFCFFIINYSVDKPDLDVGGGIFGTKCLKWR